MGVYVTTDPRTAGLAGTAGQVVTYVTGGLATLLTKHGSDDDDTLWSPIGRHRDVVTADPRTGGGLAGRLDDQVCYLDGDGVVTWLVRYDTAATAWAAWSGEALASNLSSLGSSQGALLHRGPSGWTALAPGDASTVLTSNGTGAALTWEAPSSSGVTDGDKGDVTVSVSGSAWTVTSVNGTPADDLTAKPSRGLSVALSLARTLR